MLRSHLVERDLAAPHNDSAMLWLRVFLDGRTEGRHLLQGHGWSSWRCFLGLNVPDSLGIRGPTVGFADDRFPGPGPDTRDNGTHG